MKFELHFNKGFEIYAINFVPLWWNHKFYGSTIGVRNLVCYVPLGQQFNVAIQEKHPHPQPPYQASAWSYR